MTIWVYDNEESYDAWQMFLIKTDLPREAVAAVMGARFHFGVLVGRIDRAEWFSPEKLDSLAEAGLLGLEIEDGRFGDWTLPLLREARDGQAGAVERAERRVAKTPHDAVLFGEQNSRMRAILGKIDAAIERVARNRE